MASELPPDLVRSLRAGWVTRQDILKILDIDAGVKQAVRREAERSGLIAERRDKGMVFVVSYRLREPNQGETAGSLVEVHS